MTSIRTSIQTPAGFSQPGRSTKKDRTSSHDDHRPPRSRGFQSIPAPEVLSSLIRRAVAAMKDGVYWDRGSILNIEV